MLGGLVMKKGPQTAVRVLRAERGQQPGTSLRSRLAFVVLVCFRFWFPFLKRA